MMLLRQGIPTEGIPTEGIPTVKTVPTTSPIWWLLLIAFPLLVGFGPPRLLDQVYTPSQQIGVGETKAWLELNRPPALSAAAYLLYDSDADRVLFAHNSGAALPIASLTKLMTALLVLERADLQAEVVIQASDLVGGTAMQLVPGELITVEELLWGMLIPSGNDAATALARYLSGSVDAFVAEMNTRAVALGLRQTHFVNPHGLDADGHLSSVNDLLILVRHNWDYPLFRQIVSTQQINVNGHLLQNTNQLLGTVAGANGVKTGTTDAAGQCLVAGIQQDGHQIFAIILGSSDRYRDAQTLYDRYREDYRWVTGDPGQFSILDRLYDANGRLWYLRSTAAPPTVFLPVVRGGQLYAYRHLDQLAAQPWQAGMQVGVVEWHLGDVVVGTQPLYLW